jgi:hypothetical protein
MHEMQVPYKYLTSDWRLGCMLKMELLLWLSAIASSEHVLDANDAILNSTPNKPKEAL